MSFASHILISYPGIVLAGFLAHFGRYILIAGGAYLLFYVLFRRQAISRKIQTAFPHFAQMRREIFFSLLSFAVFGGVGVVSYILFQAGLAKIYFRIEQYGSTYFALSVGALILIHDSWFYWTHRLMHWRRLFPLMHRVHHLSRNPTPWASFAFHPTEALVQAAIFPLTSLVLPVHPFAVLLWLLYMTLMNVGGHLGFEILPRGFATHRVFRWHNTTVHHDMHHRHINCNYGLYFNVWDRLMDTNHAHYEEEFDRVTALANRAETNGARRTLPRQSEPIEA
jgi:lathosterol oxidase